MRIGVDEPPGVQNFSSWPVADAAGEVEQLAQGDAERRFVLAGPRHVAGQRVEREALATSRCRSRNHSTPLSTMAGTLRDRLDVVDDGRAGVEAGDGRERRAQPRLAAIALERVEQRRLLAADVGARAGVHDDVEVEAGAEDVACRG